MSDYLAEVPWHLRFLKDVKSMKTLLNLNLLVLIVVSAIPSKIFFLDICIISSDLKMIFIIIHLFIF